MRLDMISIFLRLDKEESQLRLVLVEIGSNCRSFIAFLISNRRRSTLQSILFLPGRNMVSNWIRLLAGYLLYRIPILVKFDLDRCWKALKGDL